MNDLQFGERMRETLNAHPFGENLVRYLEACGLIAIKTRHGGKIHAGGSGSSSSNCGVWNRGHNQHFRVNPRLVARKNLCEKCYPVHVRDFGRST